MEDVLQILLAPDWEYFRHCLDSQPSCLSRHHGTLVFVVLLPLMARHFLAAPSPVSVNIVAYISEFYLPKKKKEKQVIVPESYLTQD